MQIVEKNKEGLTRELEVVVAAAMVEEKLQEHLIELRPKAVIRGFRPGKAPMDVIRKQYGKSGLNTVIQTLMNQLCNDVIKERKERQYSRALYYLPEKWDEDLLAGQDISVSLAYEVYPEIDLKPFAEFKVKRTVYEVTDEVINSSIMRLAGQDELFEKRANGGPAENGDRLKVSLDVKADGKKVDELSVEDLPIVLGDSNPIKEVDNALIGANVGEYRKTFVTLPEDFGNKKYANKEVEVEIHVIELEKKKEFKIDDQLAQRLSCKDESELRKLVRQRLEESFQSQSNQVAKDELSEQLLTKHEFLVTDAMIDLEVQSGWQDYQYTIENKTSSELVGDLTEEEFGKQWREYYERNLRLRLIFLAYADKYDIKVSEEELKNSLQSSISTYSNSEEMKKYFSEKKNLADYTRLLNSQLTLQKALDYIFEHVEIIDETNNSTDFEVIESNTESS